MSIAVGTAKMHTMPSGVEYRKSATFAVRVLLNIRTGGAFFASGVENCWTFTALGLHNDPDARTGIEPRGGRGQRDEGGPGRSLSGCSETDELRANERRKQTQVTD